MRKQRGGIAFFDSGIGGLTVVNECKKLLPNEIFYYYGDNQHAPYGNLPPNKIKKYVFRAFKRFEKMKVRAAVVACNTATAVCIEDLRIKFKFPIIGAEPALFPAGGTVGEVFVLTTCATYKSPRFQHLCNRAKEIFPFAHFTLHPCEHLAEEIEKHILEEDGNYAALLPEGKPNAVVLGCTHYVYIADYVRNLYRCPVFDGNLGIATRLQAILQSKMTGNGHSQPLCDHFQPFEGKTCRRSLKKIKKKTGKVLVKNETKKSKKIIRVQCQNCKADKGNKGIVFLGNRKKYNQKIYEHLFF